MKKCIFEIKPVFPNKRERVVVAGGVGMFLGMIWGGRE